MGTRGAKSITSQESMVVHGPRAPTLAGCRTCVCKRMSTVKTGSERAMGLHAWIRGACAVWMAGALWLHAGSAWAQTPGTDAAAPAAQVSAPAATPAAA